MAESSATGLIFISHASSDKDFVDNVVRRIPKSHLFYDINTINPGDHTTDALDDGLLNATVFVMFVSPDTSKSVWVEYESGVAYVQKIRRNHLNIVAVPIKGATYRDAPEWMQSYMAVPPGYGYSDIARLLKYLHEDSLRNQGTSSTPLFVGREQLCNKLIVETRSKAADTGIPVNFLVLAGIQQMGRSSIARNVLPKIYPGCRRDFPIFELARYADAVDLFLALRQDISGESGTTWAEAQIAAFPSDPTEQAAILMANLAHFAEINQIVIIRSAFGLRNQSKILKEWINFLFRAMRYEPNVRVVWISERLLAPESIREHPNVIQLSVPEMQEPDIVYLLTELLEVTTSSPSALKRIAPHVNGHPGSAYYVASLITRSQRSPETLADKPDSIRVFQEECVQEAISTDAVGKLGQEILALLRLLPWTDYDTIVRVFSDYPAVEISQTLWDMSDNCVINYSMSAGYRVAEIVRSVSSDYLPELAKVRVESLAQTITDALESSAPSQHAVEALIFVYVRLNGVIPDELKKLLTGATLLDVVEQYYRLGHKFTGSWQDHFRTAARLSVLSSQLPMSIDTLESILFNGADSLIRIGEDPSDIVQIMQSKKLPSVNYILGSYYYHQKRDPDIAIPYLEKALQDRSYTKRTGRLLAKLYMEKGLPKAGLNVFSILGEGRVNRDTGLLAQKIRCLRACGQQVEANKLVIAMKSLEDEFGEYEILIAAKLMKEGQYESALKAINRAKLKPKVNRINLRLLETAILIEKGDSSGLEDTCKLANAIGLGSGAHSLRARYHLKRGEWRPAEAELTKLEHKNYYDKLLVLRMLTLKKDDLIIVADPLTRGTIQTQHNQMLVELRRDADGEWSYDEANLEVGQ